ncbi:MAG TPA: hypothetical protein VEL74_20790 [Thermoanaerobaculia bacterium]|nr:hypothetical protein [Thermoanaerobaculia bacterium]
MIRSNKMLALLALGLAAAVPGEAADPQVVHKVELQSGAKAVTIEQRFVPVANGTDVQLIARGPVTGAKTVAVMYANGELAVKVDKAWWKSFFSANSLTGEAALLPVEDGGRTLAALTVSGGGSSHLIGVSMVDPDNPWGPCPGPDDVPTCRPEAVVIPFWCKLDVDQCSGGPLPGPWAIRATTDPDGDPMLERGNATDLNGDPARGLAILRFSLDAAELSVNGTLDLGTTALSIDGSQGFDYRGPGF